jgi:general secretion pathway protein L
MLSIQSYFRSANAILNRAWNWWVSELVETFRLLSHFNKSNIIEFEVSQISGVVLKDGARTKNIGGVQNVSLKFNDNAILYRKIKLPVAARKNIDKVVHYEFNKYFPMNVDDALISCEVIQPAIGAESIEVEIWTISKTVIDEHLKKIHEQYGIETKFLYIKNSKDQVLISDDILKSQRVNDKRPSANLQKAMNIMIIALLLALLIYPILKIDMHLKKLQEEVTLLETEAQPIIQIREKILLKEERFHYLINKKKENPDQAYMWSRITKFISDKAILNRMKINGRNVQLDGKAASVEQIIKIFESDTEISDVKVIGSVTTTDNNLYEAMKLSLTINN